MSRSTSSPVTNPFCTRRIRPGALPFQFPPGESVTTLVEWLEANRWRGAIIGPHGSGKSTLLETLIPEIEQHSDRRVLRFSLHDGQRCLSRDWRTRQNPRGLNENSLIVIDGYEQLSRWSRLRLRWSCWKSGAGLLVTAHAPVSLPLLFRTRPTVELAQQIVENLLANYDPNQVRLTSNDVMTAFASHAGNIRETLLALYDQIEESSRSERSGYIP